MTDYHPKSFWEKRLSNFPNLEGVGYLGVGETYNKTIYLAKQRAMQRGLKKAGLTDLHDFRVLDLGAGIGFWVDYFLQQGVRECVGIDLTEVAVKMLQERFPDERASFLQADISDETMPSLISKQFSLVNMIDVAFHIVDDDLLEKAVVNISQLTANYFVFTDVLFAHHPSPASQVRWRTLDYWQTLLTKNHLEFLFAVPMYVLLHPGYTGHYRIANMFHRLNRRVGKMPRIRQPYFQMIYAVDGLLTRIGGTAQQLVFAVKR